MRRLRSTLILLVVAVAFGAYLYFIESKRTPSSVTVKPKAVDVPADKIEQISIKSASGDRTTLVKSKGAWEVTAPVVGKAADSDVSAIATSLGGLEIQRVVDENPANLKQFGLDPPRVEVTFKTAGAPGETKIFFGDKTQTGSDMYARLASEKRLILVSGFLDATFNKGTFDLRDKTALKFDREKVDQLDITTPAGHIQLAKNNLDWDMKAPFQTRADNGVVSELLTKLETLAAKSFPPANAGDQASYGLDKPAGTLVIKAGDTRMTVQVGNNADESSTYAKSSERPEVFTVDNLFAKALTAKVAEFRRKDVFDFQSYNATRLELTRNGSTIAFEKAPAPAGTDSEKWRQVSPTTRDVDGGKIQTALSKLSYLRAQDFVDPKATRTGLEAPAVSALVKYENGQKEDRVKLTKTAAGPFAARADWPDAARLDANAYQGVIESLDDLTK